MIVEQGVPRGFLLAYFFGGDMAVTLMWDLLIRFGAGTDCEETTVNFGGRGFNGSFNCE